MTLKEIKKILKAEVIIGEDYLSMEVKMGCASDLMSDVLAYAKPDALLLTGLTNSQVIRTAEIVDIRAVCFIRGKKPDERTIKLAIEKNIVLLTTQMPMFESCGRLYKNGLASRLVKHK
ncbi:MAG: hypothetical protein HY769_07815 [Candidatus Stahlbacteria bacterium]|nr:hypothetical protein [Candidatus Stahlbacteria bacterium]